MTQRVPRWWKPRKFPTWEFAVMSDSYVWCDEHGEIHGASEDLYVEGNERCNEENWRPVYVASDEADEEF